MQNKKKKFLSALLLASLATGFSSTVALADDFDAPEGKIVLVDGDKQEILKNKVENFVGGTSAETAKEIYFNSNRSLTINNYSGHTNVNFKFIGLTPQNHGDSWTYFENRGNVIIKEAKKDSVITLFADASEVQAYKDGGIAYGKYERLDKVLNDLSNHVIYRGYKNFPQKLTAIAKVKEGLTSSGAEMRFVVGNIGWQENPYGDEEDGDDIVTNSSNIHEITESIPGASQPSEDSSSESSGGGASSGSQASPAGGETPTSPNTQPSAPAEGAGGHTGVVNSAGTIQTVDNSYVTDTQIVEDARFGKVAKAFWDANNIRHLADNNVNYTFDKDISITSALNNRSYEDNSDIDKFVTKMNVYSPIMWGGDVTGTINLNNHNMKLTATNGNPGAMATGIYTSSGNLTINNLGKISINTENGPVGFGILVMGVRGEVDGTQIQNGKASLVINNDDSEDHAVKIAVNTTKNYGNLAARGNSGTANLVIKGLVDIDANGQTYDAVDSLGGNIEVGGGKIIGGQRSAFRVALGGNVEVNASLDSASKNVTVTKNTRNVQITGDALVEGRSKLVLGLGNKDSFYKGRIHANTWGLHVKDDSWLKLNEDGKTFELPKYTNPEDKYNYLANGENPGDVYMSLQDGATWVHEKHGDYAGNGLSRLTKLQARNGIIIQRDSSKIVLDKLSGSVNVMYDHDNNGTQDTDYKAGTIEVKAADPDSSLTVSTDATNINEDNHDAVFTALAKKAFYIAKDQNLTGHVAILEGLTSSSQAKSLGDMVFDETTGQGKYNKKAAVVEDSEHSDVAHDEPVGDTHEQGDQPASGAVNNHEAGHAVAPPQADNNLPNAKQDGLGKIIYGPEDTQMMRGVRSTMVMPSVVLRQGMNDISKRLGDIRFNKKNLGVWANIEGGKSVYKGANTSADMSMTNYQIGFDKVATNNWLIGGVLQYIDGEVTSNLVDGTNKLFNVGVYGSKVEDNGAYVDVLAKYGRIKNDFSVTNSDKHTIKGKYNANAYILSGEYGKRNYLNGNKGHYIEPQFELTYMHMPGVDYTATSDFAGNPKLFVNQSAYNSLVARAGLAYGYQDDKGSAYAKVSVLHDFTASLDTTYHAVNQPTKTTTYEMKNTWLSLQVGGTKTISKDKYIYGNIATGFGAAFHDKWKANVGVRFNF